MRVAQYSPVILPSIPWPHCDISGCVAKKEMTCKGLSPAQSGSLSGQATPRALLGGRTRLPLRRERGTQQRARCNSRLSSSSALVCTT